MKNKNNLIIIPIFIVFLIIIGAWYVVSRDKPQGLAENAPNIQEERRILQSQNDSTKIDIILCGKEYRVESFMIGKKSVFEIIQGALQETGKDYLCKNLITNNQEKILDYSIRVPNPSSYRIFFEVVAFEINPDTEEVYYISPYDGSKSLLN